MVRRVYVDTAWKSKLHTCYDPAEDGFFEVEDLAELAGRYDEVYIDCALFPNMWPQLKALINDGARVFYFAWPWKWKRLREKYADDLKRKFWEVEDGLRRRIRFVEDSWYAKGLCGSHAPRRGVQAIADEGEEGG
ncbi:MAG: hypothetical protein QXU12_00180 [Nitrososphaerota archaeon]